MLDVEDDLALQLVREGEHLPCRIAETDTNFAIEWDCHYAIVAGGFLVEGHSSGKQTVFLGYPLEEIATGVRRARQVG